jgi:hypothetical protein
MLNDLFKNIKKNIRVSWVQWRSQRIPDAFWKIVKENVSHEKEMDVINAWSQSGSVASFFPIKLVRGDYKYYFNDFACNCPLCKKPFEAWQIRGRVIVHSRSQIEMDLIALCPECVEGSKGLTGTPLQAIYELQDNGDIVEHHVSEGEWIKGKPADATKEE